MNQAKSGKTHPEGKTILPEIHKHINSAWNKEDLLQQWILAYYYLFVTVTQMPQYILGTLQIN
jgi:hypothetical protein